MRRRRYRFVGAIVFLTIVGSIAALVVLGWPWSLLAFVPLIAIPVIGAGVARRRLRRWRETLWAEQAWWGGCGWDGPGYGPGGRWETIRSSSAWTRGEPDRM